MFVKLSIALSVRSVMNRAKLPLDDEYLLFLVDKHGSPLFAYAADQMSASYRELKDALGQDIDLFYSLKANPNISVCKHLEILGASFDVSSLSELQTVVFLNINPNRIIYTGSGKSRAELVSAVEYGVFCIVVESLEELTLLNHIGELHGKVVKVAIRLNSNSFRPHNDKHSNQFGVDASELRHIINNHKKLFYINVVGIHAHMGSRCLDPQAIINNVDLLLTMSNELFLEHSLPLEMVDVGGGFGVPYFREERAMDLEVLKSGLQQAVTKFRRNRPQTRIISESGRYIVSESGVYVCTALYTKTIGRENYIITDGGITSYYLPSDNINNNYANLSDRNFPVTVLCQKGIAHKPVNYTICGPTATPSDVLVRNLCLPRVVPGERIATGMSGAYGPTASLSNFLGKGYPAEIFVKDSKDYLIRKRDTPGDMLMKQHLYTEQDIQGAI